jgi:hypothetical protein
MIIYTIGKFWATFSVIFYYSVVVIKSEHISYDYGQSRQLKQRMSYMSMKEEQEQWPILR